MTTDEQIKQKAELYAELLTAGNKEHYRAIYTAAKEGYETGAHSRDEEIEELKEELESLKENEKELFEGFTKRGTKLGELMKENVKLRNPWISVEDRLPEGGQAVIVRLAFGAGNHAACNYINGQFVWALCIETSNVNIQSRLKLPAITHWMPIPEFKN